MDQSAIKDQTKKSIKEISSIFVRFAEDECKNRSPLYYQLSLDISQSSDILKLASHATFRQPMPNLLLGSVHYLLLKSPKEKLANFYPSITKKNVSGIPFDLFKEFVQLHQSEILTILQERIVQTNELNRTASLMPVIASVFNEKEEVTLIDIGTSAGLNLNWDKYEYDYGQHDCYGKSPVKVKSEILEGTLPAFNSFPKKIRKIGIDQNPLDLKISNNELWLKSLIWPDQIERFERFESAIEFARKESIELIKARSIKEFEDIINSIKQDKPLMVFHTSVIYQFTPIERIELWKMLDRVGTKRDYYYLAIEGIEEMVKRYNTKGMLIELTEYKNKQKKQKLLGITNAHGNWLRWKE